MEIKILIDDIEYVCESGYSITQQIGAVGSASVVAKIPAGGIIPRTFMSCQILADEEPIFGGLIMNVSSPTFCSGYEVKKYALSVSSWEAVLNNRLVSEAFTSVYTHDIIAALFDSYMAAEGFTLGKIDDSPQLYESYTCSYTQLSQILNELADDCGFTYYITPDKVFYFISRTSFTQIDAPAHITNVKLEEESGDIRTRQIVTGATEDTDTQTAGCYWTAGQTVLSLGYQIASITGVTIDGVTCGVGVIGVDEENTAKTFLYSVGGTELVLNANATTKPATGANVVCVYKGYFDVVVDNTNNSLQAEIAALSGTSGIIENVLTDTTIDNYIDADAKSLAMLNQYGERDQTVSCDAHGLTDTALSTLWVFALTGQNISGSFVVVERTITSYGKDSVWINVKLRNKGYFARYGTTLVSKPKTAGSDTKIYKSASAAESVTVGERLSVDHCGLVFYPTDGSAYVDTLLDGFYPI